MDSLTWLNDLIHPMMVVVQTIPTIAIAPILVLWLAMDFAQDCLDNLTTTPIIISILDGLGIVTRICWPCLVWCERISWQILWHFKIPVSLPYFYAGLRVSVSTPLSQQWYLSGWEALKGLVFIWFSPRNCFSMIPCLPLLFWCRLSAFSVWSWSILVKNTWLNETSLR